MTPREAREAAFHEAADGFRVFARTEQRGRLPGGAYLRVGKSGNLTLTVPAMRILHDCGLVHKVQILHNPDTGDVALRPTGEDDPNGYSIRRNSVNGGALSARAFIAYTHLEHGTVFSCEKTDDGMLIGHRAEGNL